jgi:hypothetical protein
VCLRRTLCSQLVAMLPDNIQLFFSHRGARSLLRIDDAFMVSILFCRSEQQLCRNRQLQAYNKVGRPIVPGQSWGAEPPIAERQHITLICLLSKRCDHILNFYVVNKMGDRAYMRLRKTGEFLQQAIKLRRIEDFYKAVINVWEQRKANSKPSTAVAA